MSDSRVAIVIVTYNSADVIGACLRSISETTRGMDIDVTVVDNASRDETAAIIADVSPSTNVVASTDNLGFAGGNNLGVQRSSGDYVLLLNPDTVVLPGAVAVLAAELDRRPDVWAVGPCLLDAEQRPTMSYGDLPTLRWALSELTAARRLGLRSTSTIRGIPVAGKPSHDVGFVSGAAIMVRRGVWERLGGMDEDYFLYFEETDLCARIHSGGGRVVLVPKAYILHLESTSFAGRDLMRQLRFYQGLMLFFSKDRGRAQTAVLRTVVLAENLAYVVADAIFGRWLPRVRANRMTHRALVRLVLSRGVTSRAAREMQD